MNLADYWPGQRVIARYRIEDSPLAREDGSAKSGDEGWIDDIDYAGGLLMVDFGRGSIAVSPEEVTP